MEQNSTSLTNYDWINVDCTCALVLVSQNEGSHTSVPNPIVLVSDRVREL